MMSNKSKTLVIVLISLLISSCSPLIGSTRLLDVSLGSNTKFDRFTFWLSIGNAKRVIELELSGDETGKKYVLCEGEAFDKLAAVLSNGQNDEFEFGMDEPGGGSSRRFNEAFFFFNDGTGASGVDLVGQPITCIEFVVNYVSLVEFQGWTEAYGLLTLNIYGDQISE